MMKRSAAILIFILLFSIACSTVGLVENIPTPSSDPQDQIEILPTETPQPDPTATPDSLLYGQPGVIAFTSSRGGSQDIWLVNADGSNLVQLLDNDIHEYDPAWSPDGSQIAFRSNSAGYWDIWLMDADGENLVRLTEGPGNDFDPVCGHLMAARLLLPHLTIAITVFGSWMQMAVTCFK